MADTIKVHGEECEAHTRFEDLRQFDIVWWLGCTWCGKDHRLTMAQWVSDEPVHITSGDIRIVNGWRVLDPPPCNAKRRVRGFILSDRTSVKIHRVVNLPRGDASSDYELPKSKPAYDPVREAVRELAEHARQIEKEKQTSKG